MTTESGFYLCPYCHSERGFVYVHSHYQCQTCGNNVNPCCGGEQVDECTTFSGRQVPHPVSPPDIERCL